MTAGNKKIRGRGASGNPDVRYLSENREAFNDDWQREELDESIATSVAIEHARSIIARNQSPDIPFEQSINPYRGCEHGCSYCYARPTHAYLDLSPGLDFETRLTAKENAAQLLKQEIAADAYVCSPIALGTNTDPYQPIERKYKITRSILELLARHKHPLTIVTKSHLVQRDMDLLAALAEQELVQVFVSVTTLDRELASTLEPRASTPFRRIQTIRTLSEAGVPVGLMFAPVIPMVNDAEMETIIESCAEAGAETAGYVMLRLPHEVKELFRDWLARYMPLKKERVMNMLRDIRGGKDYDPGYHTRLRGEGEFAALIKQRFTRACTRSGLNRKRRQLNCQLFEKPILPGAQFEMFQSQES